MTVLIVLISFFSIFPILTNSQFIRNDHLNVRNVSRIPNTFLANNENIRFIAIGDWGYGQHHQQEVADAMGIWCQDGGGGSKCDFIISNGDNFYSDGVNSVHDKQFVEKWKNVYTHPSIANLPWYVIHAYISLTSRRLVEKMGFFIFQVHDCWKS